MEDQKIYIPLDKPGELIERFEALRKLNIPIEKLRERDSQAEENFSILISIMVDFSIREIGQRTKYHLEEAAQEYLVG